MKNELVVFPKKSLLSDIDFKQNKHNGISKDKGQHTMTRKNNRYWNLCSFS